MICHPERSAAESKDLSLFLLGALGGKIRDSSTAFRCCETSLRMTTKGRAESKR
jgi:hypothetical protein